MNPLQTAYDWSIANNYSTWVGAWMPGNYNKGNNFDIPQQAAFGSFISRSLAAKNIPWSVNAGKKFYDYIINDWIVITYDAGSLAVLDAMLDPETIVLYENTHYGGASLRLGTGLYDQSDLTLLGFIKSDSIMVPIDYKVTLYTQSGFQGTPTVYTATNQNLLAINIQSLTIEYIPFV